MQPGDKSLLVQLHGAQDSNDVFVFRMQMQSDPSWITDELGHQQTVESARERRKPQPQFVFLSQPGWAKRCIETLGEIVA